MALFIAIFMVLSGTQVNIPFVICLTWNLGLTCPPTAELHTSVTRSITTSRNSHRSRTRAIALQVAMTVGPLGVSSSDFFDFSFVVWYSSQSLSLSSNDTTTELTGLRAQTQMCGLSPEEPLTIKCWSAEVNACSNSVSVGHDFHGILTSIACTRWLSALCREPLALPQLLLHTVTMLQDLSSLRRPHLENVNFSMVTAANSETGVLRKYSTFNKVAAGRNRIASYWGGPSEIVEVKTSA
jgi:hypothetical protein